MRDRRGLLLQRCPGPLGEGGSEPWELPTKLTGQVTERSTRRAFRARAQLEAEGEREGGHSQVAGPPHRRGGEAKRREEEWTLGAANDRVPRTQWGRGK